MLAKTTNDKKMKEKLLKKSEIFKGLGNIKSTTSEV
jgi:hypothetical protein